VNALSILFLFALSQPSYRDGEVTPFALVGKFVCLLMHGSSTPCCSAMDSVFELAHDKASDLTIFMASGLEAAARALTRHPP